MHNELFWSGYFRRMFQPHLERTLQVLETRLLPTFDDIEAEAKAIEEKAYADLMSLPLDPDMTDESMLAEAAFEAGYDHYSGMDTVRQALINAFAPLLYHTWEQQLIAFHRKEVLGPKEENDNRLLQVKVLQKRLMDAGLDIRRLQSWSTLEELKLVANTVKHADGESADRLKTARPDLFQINRARGVNLTTPAYPRRVYYPMSGEDLYLTLTDLREYGHAAIAFWDEFADALA
ncbi:hypothetical protein [Paraburkholderia bannensis]|uniref:hypothetical protein n=1 Tax=Paraburkholderia bannensis TaxID=765414 RepID=UPI0004851D3A|nr:hypothetical protein [Paraburkholderia bannensis]